MKAHARHFIAYSNHGTIADLILPMEPDGEFQRIETRRWRVRAIEEDIYWR